MILINLTPHRVDIYPSQGEMHIEPSGTVARVTENRNVLEVIDSVEITETEYGEVYNLPDPQLNTAYIVSPLVLEHSFGRDDLLVPDILVRDNEGRIIGCRTLAKRLKHNNGKP